MEFVFSLWYAWKSFVQFVCSIVYWAGGDIFSSAFSTNSSCTIYVIIETEDTNKTWGCCVTKTNVA